MEKAYKFRLYPNKEQSILIQKTFGSCRFVFNRYLDKRIKLYEEDKKTMGYNECANDLTTIKSEYEWLKEVDSTALQSSLKDLDNAYKNFLDALNKAMQKQVSRLLNQRRKVESRTNQK